MNASDLTLEANAPTLDLETLFAQHYSGVARAIAKLIRNPSRAEELAVDVFLKWKPTAANPETAKAHLYRIAICAGLDELRAKARWNRFEGLLQMLRPPQTPEQIHMAKDQYDKVGKILSSMSRNQAALILLRAEGLTYEELASALKINPASVGTLLSRAQKQFKKEYEKRYGTTE